MEPVPQLTTDSANDICLKKDGALCIIMIVKDKASLDQNNVNAMNAVGQNFASKISRGISFYFSWVDASVDTDFAAMFNIPAEDLPKLVVMNPGKRKRFLIHENEISEKTIEATLDKILGGDARFKTIKGNEIPALVSVHEKAE